MPSLLHEGLLELIRKRPEFGAVLLDELLDVPVPEFTDAEIVPEHAARVPELAVLSVMAHGRGDQSVALAVALAAAHGISHLDRDLWVLYFGLIEASLSDAVRKAFQMLPEGQRFFSESQQQSFERGQAEGQAKMLLAFLEARGLTVTEQQRERILACTDLDVLERWVRQAATAASTDELFSN